jgi:hypothetical protein
MKPRVGTTLSSTTDDTTVVVVRWGSADLDLTCGGAPMVVGRPAPEDRREPTAAAGEGTRLGKRYTDEGAGVELLCTKPGTGDLVLDGAVLRIKDAKPLPASD